MGASPHQVYFNKEIVMLKKMLLLTVLTVMLAACLPSQQPTADVQSQINTAIAETMQVKEQIDQAVEGTVSAIQNAQATEPQNQVDSTIALQATETPTPTAAPFIIPTITPTFIKPTPSKYSCSAVTLKPKTNELFPGGIAIDIKWRITNTGTATWYDSVDMKYVGGANFADFNRIEMGKGLKPGESVIVEVDAHTPKKGGSYFMSWLVDGPMCYGYVTIKVK